MVLRRLIRALAQPVIIRLARLFLTRSDFEVSQLINNKNAELLAQLAIRVEQIADGLRTTDSELTKVAHARDMLDLFGRQSRERHEALELLNRQLSERHDAYELLSRQLHQRYDAFETLSIQTNEQNNASDLLTRQAIHDIASCLLGGREILSKSESTVGIVIPTCDRPAALRRALTSVAAQTRKPDRVIVVNDGLEDVSVIVNEFSHRLSIQALKTPAPYSGSSMARNLALDVLDTSFVAFLDDDNLMWPRWIERGAAFLEADSKIDILYGAQLRDEECSTTAKNWFLIPFNLESLSQGNFIDMNQLMHRSGDIRFDPRIKRIVDWDYVLRLIDSQPHRIIAVDAISSVYSTSEAHRISVMHWPPDLLQNIATLRDNTPAPQISTSLACSCCGYVGAFSPGPRQRANASCPQCASLERHRFLQLVGPLLRDFWVPQTCAPERATLIEVGPSHATGSFRSLFGATTTVDAYPDADGRDVDLVASLTDLPMPSNYADVIVALHVLEHIPDDRKAMAEIARVLAPSGVAVLQVPMSGVATTDEEPLDAPEQRLARYGQEDHVRLYGTDFYTRLSEPGLTPVAVSPRESMRLESIHKYGLLPDEPLVFAVRTEMSRTRNLLDIFTSSLRKGRSVIND